MVNIPLAEVEVAKELLRLEVETAVKKFTLATGIDRVKLEPVTTTIEVEGVQISSTNTVEVTLYL